MRKGRIVKEYDASCISEEELSEMIMLGEATAEKSKV
jgi:hypothetical protein